MLIIIGHVVSWCDAGYQLFTERGGEYYHFHDTECRTYSECLKICKEHGYSLASEAPIEI